MTTDLDLDDVAADHPLAMRELAALRRVSDAAHLVHDAAHEITSDAGLGCFVARKHFVALGDAIAAMRDEQAPVVETVSERAAFEAWCLREGWSDADLRMTPLGGYESAGVQAASRIWHACWQAEPKEGDA